MIAPSAETPGRYYLDAARFNYALKGQLIAVWVDERLHDGTYKCQPLRGGEPVGTAVWVSGKVLYASDNGTK